MEATLSSSVCYPHIVVGSGPTGVSAALALLSEGEQVLMIDGGLDEDSSLENKLNALVETGPERWSDSDVAFLKNPPMVRGLPRKLAYGSDFPYNELPSILGPFIRDNTTVASSLARGGLSNVWGAGVMPFADSDLREWGLSQDELRPAFDATLNLMGYSAQSDDLEEIHPLFGTPGPGLEPTRQIKDVLSHMRRHHAVLRRRKFVYGRSRVAVETRQENSCNYCGLCMYGCPRRLVYNSMQSVAKLKQEFPGFSYQPGWVVQSFDERAEHVALLCRNFRDSRPLTLRAKRAYLACGALATTKVVLRSLGRFRQPVRLKDSQYYVTPSLSLRKAPGITQDRLATLAQVFLEIMDPEFAPNVQHLAVFSYNDLYDRALSHALGRLSPAFGILRKQFLERFMVVGGYLHSADSGYLEVTLEDSAPESGPALRLKGVQNPESARKIAAVLRKLLRNSLRLGFVPLIPLRKITLPGTGYHIGGSFPMKRDPGPVESDMSGRPAHLRRVHLVDSTVLPTIPSGTLTLNTMANAYRIGKLAVKEGPG